MAEHVPYSSSAPDGGGAINDAKAAAKAAGRRVRTLVGVKGQPGHWIVTLALDELLVPAVKDPVVVDGVKYRIREVGEQTVRAKTSFGDDWVSVALTELTWDRVAGVWRVAA